MMDKIDEIAERIVCGGNLKNLSRLNKSGALSMSEVGTRELHENFLKSARLMSGLSKGSRNFGFSPEVDDYMDLMLGHAIAELTKMKSRY